MKLLITFGLSDLKLLYKEFAIEDNTFSNFSFFATKSVSQFNFKLKN